MNEQRPIERGASAAALLLAVLLLAPSLFARGLNPPDETRYADVALAMQENGQWLVPSLHQKWYSEKPPVFFWCVAVLDQLGVPLSLGPRLVSLLAGLGMIALVPVLARGFGISAANARRGALVLATLPLFAIFCQLGFIDSLLAFEVALATACKLERDRLPPGAGGRSAWAIAEGGVLGLAILTKGPVALLFAAGLRIGAAFARGQEKSRPEPAPGRFRRHDLLALGVALLIGASWLLAAGWVGGRDYAERIFLEQLERRIGGTEPKHHAPPGFLLLIVLAGALPWTLLALGTRAPWRLRDLARPAPRLAGLLGASVLPVLVLALIPTQQPHYALPALPLLALLASEALAHPLRPGARVAAAAAGVLVGVVLVGTALFLRSGRAGGFFDVTVGRRIADDDVLQGALALGGVLLLIVVIWRRRGAAVAAVNVPLRALAGVVALFMMVPLVLWRIDDYVNARSLLESPALAAAPRVVAPTGLRSSVRLQTKLPFIEEFEDRDVLELVRADPSLLVIDWKKDLAERGELVRLDVVARGWLRGRELLAVRGRRHQSREPWPREPRR